jgi:hypothetical protein
MRKVELALMKLGLRRDEIGDMSETEAAGYLDAYCEIMNVGSGATTHKKRKKSDKK